MSFLQKLSFPGRESGPPEGYVDLHMHPVHSDGTSSSSELVQEARRLKLRAIAITDHDTVSALDEARECAASTGVEVVMGVELSCVDGRSDVHLLGYGMDRDLDGLEAALAGFRAARRVRAEEMVGKLQSLGLDLGMEDVLRMSGSATIGRPHVAQAMVLRGLVNTPEEAFHRYLGHGGPAWVPKASLSTAEGIRLLRGHGGRPSLAHPGTLRRDDLIPRMREEGMVGLEVWHPRHDEAARSRYLALAGKLGLMPTGGSDHHGSRTPGQPLGCSGVPGSALVDLLAVAV